ncbi:hypothetical protein LCGC14_2690040, partial [marine sediment metagenome]
VIDIILGNEEYINKIDLETLKKILYQGKIDLKFKSVEDYSTKLLNKFEAQIINRIFFDSIKTTYLTSKQLKQKYSDINFQEKFSNLFSIHLILREAITVEDYKAPVELCSNIILSQQGKNIADFLKKKFPKFKMDTIKFVIFKIFYFRELLIDIEQMNFNKILENLNSEIRSGLIKFPYVHQILYNKYFNLFQKSFSYLNFDQTWTLLEETPNGIYQVKNILIGPFGILKPNYQRFILPSNDIPLFHCPDLSCNTIHRVTLKSGGIHGSEIWKFIIPILNKIGRPSRFYKYFQYINNVYDKYFYNDLSLEDFPFLLMNAFNEEEIQRLFTELLRNFSKEIRENLPKTKKIQKIFSNSAKEIAKKLNKIECLQLILLISDKQIINIIEFLLDSNELRIPFYEKRIPWVSFEHNIFSIRTELSQYGVRSISTIRNIAPAR